MQAVGAKTEALASGAACRQMRALGGDCFDFLALPGAG